MTASIQETSPERVSAHSETHPGNDAIFGPEQLPPEFDHAPGELIDLDDEVFFLATHGVGELQQGTSQYLDPGFNNSIMKKNFSDHGTWGTEKKKGIARLWSRKNLLVRPPNARMEGDPNRNAERVTVTGDETIKPGAELVRAIDFEGVPIFSRIPPHDVLERWRTHENGPANYHAKIKQELRKRLEEKPDKQLLVVDLHDTSEWLLEDQESMRLRSYEVTESDDSKKIEHKFPLAVVSDQDGSTTKAGFIDEFAGFLEEGYRQVGVNPGTNDDPGVWGKVLANTPYKGAKVVQELGIQLKKELIEEGRLDLGDRINVVQVEVNRSLSSILDEPEQEINTYAANIEAMVLAYVINRGARWLNSYGFN